MIRFISAIILILIASYTDLKFRKVPNILIGFFLFIGIFLNIYILSSDLIFHYFIYIISAFVFSFILYFIGAWAAGDAKFFTVLVAQFPFFCCIPFVGWIGIFLNSIILFALFTLVFYSKRLFEIKYNFSKITKNLFKILLFSVIFGFISYVLFSSDLFSSILSLVIFSIILKFIHFFRHNILIQETSVNKLKQGMVLAQTIYMHENKLLVWEKPSFFQTIRKIKNHGLNKTKKCLKPQGEIIASPVARGLSKEQIQKIKKSKIRKVKTKDTFPFVPFLGIGYLSCFWSCITCLI